MQPNQTAKPATPEDELIWTAYETFVPHHHNDWRSVQDMSPAMKAFWLKFAKQRLAMGWKPRVNVIQS
jgi:hypothetical protein